MSRFQRPASTVGIQWESLKGALLLIQVLSFEAGIPTSYGETDAVKATVTVLDGDLAGTVYRETLIFPKVLVSQTKSSELVLGRLGQGEKKPGQSPPWRLEEPSEADEAKADAFLDEGDAPPF